MLARSGLIRGSILAAILAAVAYCLARYGFGRLYYLGVLAPAGAILCLLLAWLLHLKADGLARRGPSGEAGSGEPSIAHKDSPSSLFAPLDDRLVERSPRPSAGRREAGSTTYSWMRTMLWAALELALFSALLYSFFGVGASFYL